MLLKIEVSKAQHNMVANAVTAYEKAKEELSLMSGLLLASQHVGAGVLTGTAYDSETKKSYVTFRVDDAQKTEGQPEGQNAASPTNIGNESGSGSHEEVKSGS